ncbi:autotransporter outer membrane beta-barrel domain-containing protein [Rahnella sp. NRRL B-41462]|uniref:autotransporter family protein n=1 Tax=Rahnella sp. NRRL B-41462 TaxID=1610579 RepID=UPI0013003E52|nr:autotransporter outer membrane beta-barrel domain-containing protein [Rahnella sp. NRRL B-41462]
MKNSIYYKNKFSRRSSLVIKGSLLIIATQCASNAQAEKITSPVSASTGQVITLTADDELEITSTGTPAIHANNGGIIDARDATILSLTTSGDYADGIRANNGGNIYLSGGFSVTTSSFDADGLLARGGNSLIDIGPGDVHVSTSYDNTYAIFIAENSQIKIQDNVSITSSGNNGEAVTLNNQSTLESGGINITTTGKKSAGIVNKNSNIIIHDLESSIHTLGSDSTGMRNTASAQTLFNQALIISTEGAGATGIYASDAGTQVTLNGGSISTQGDNAYGVDVGQEAHVNLNQIDIDTAGVNAHGVRVGGAGQFSMTGGSIVTQNDTANAVLFDQGGGGSFTANDVLISSTGTASGMMANDGNWLATLNASQINASDAIVAYGTGTSGVQLTVNAQNNSLINGNISTTASEARETPPSVADSLYLNLTQSTLNGAAEGNVSINATQQSVWNLSASSDIAQLSMDNSQVNFASGGDYKTLTMGSLSGSGTFNLNTNLNAGGEQSQTDHIHVTGNAEGQYALLINGSGIGADAVSIPLVMIDGSSTASFLLAKEVSADAYDYTLQEGSSSDANDWYLTSEIKASPIPDPLPDPTPEPGPEPMPDPTPEPQPAPEPQPVIDRSYRPEIPAYIASTTLNLNYAYSTVGTFHQRQVNTEGVWARTEASKTSYNAGRFGYDTNTWFLQMGNSIYKQQADNGTQTDAGVMVTLGHQTTDAQDQLRSVLGKSVDTGSLRTDAYSLGSYYTRMASDGGYLDLVGQITWYRNQFDSRYDAKQDSYGGLLSAEAGKPWTIAGSVKIEPQMQLAYQYLKSGGFSDEISDIKSHHTNAGMGRAGMRIYHDSATSFISPYLTLDTVHILNNTPSTQIGESTLNADMASDWWQAGTGFSSNIKGNTSFYGEIKYQKGYNNDIEGVMGSLGVKATF